MVPTEDLARWAVEAGANVLAPSRASYLEFSDKATLEPIMRGSGVALPTSRIVRKGDHDAVTSLLNRGHGEFVLQRLGDGFSGQGTRLIRSIDEFDAAVSEFDDDRYKASLLVAGLPCTVSGYIAAGGVSVTTVTHQLVTLDGVRFGEHFGNQLVSDRVIGVDATTRLRQVAHRVGERLRARGALGTFGVDAILTPEAVVLIEINPRMQSTTALGAWQEWKSGLLPGPLLHVLLQVDSSIEFRPAHLVQSAMSQSHVRTPQRVAALSPMPDGAYCVRDGALRLVSSRPSVFLNAGDVSDLIWVWSSASEKGAIVEAGGIVAIVQSHTPLYEVVLRPARTEHGATVHEAVLNNFSGCD
jgi:hypothetical protein